MVDSRFKFPFFGRLFSRHIKVYIEPPPSAGMAQHPPIVKGLSNFEEATSEEAAIRVGLRELPSGEPHATRHCHCGPAYCQPLSRRLTVVMFEALRTSMVQHLGCSTRIEQLTLGLDLGRLAGMLRATPRRLSGDFMRFGLGDHRQRANLNSA
jgi:hypothetical protein